MTRVMRDHEELVKFKTTLNWEKSVLESQENPANVTVRYIIILGKEKHLDYGSPCRVLLNLKKIFTIVMAIWTKVNIQRVFNFIRRGTYFLTNITNIKRKINRTSTLLRFKI